MSESVSLKWGSLKSYSLDRDESKAALEKYLNTGEHNFSAMLQRDTDEQKVALCEFIDSVDCDTVYLEWDGVDVSKEEAKRYIMEYGKK